MMWLQYTIMRGENQFEVHEIFKVHKVIALIYELSHYRNFINLITLQTE